MDTTILLTNVSAKMLEPETFLTMIKFFCTHFYSFLGKDFRSSCSQMFFKIGALKNFAVFTGKHLCWSLFLMKLQAFRGISVNIAKFLRRASLFHRTPLVAAFVSLLFSILTNQN